MSFMINPFVSGGGGGGGGAFTPGELYTGGAAGDWLDISDLSRMYTDDGVTNVTADGDLVYRIDGQEGNLIFRQATASARPTYKTDGTYHWLLFGPGDRMSASDVTALRGAGGIFVDAAILSSSGTANRGVSGMWAGPGNWALLSNDISVASNASFLVRDGGGTNQVVDTAGDATDGAGHVLGGIYDQSNILVGLDGAWTTGPAVASLTTAAEGIWIGSYDSATIFDGRLYGYVLMEGAPTGGQRSDTDAWLAGKHP